jgi:hypothetical protein
LEQVAGYLIGPMRMDHDGLSVPLNSHSRIVSLSMFGFFSNKMDHPSRKKEFFKSPGIWKKSRNDSIIQFTSDQETIGTADEMCFDDIIEKVHYGIS